MKGSRGRLALAAVAALILVGAGALAGRATAPVGPGSASGATEPQVAAPGEGTSGHRAAVPSLAGPHARTPDGAVAAATGFGVALDGPLVLDAERRDEVIDLVAASDARDPLRQQFADLAELLESRLGLDRQTTEDPGFVWRAVPAGWQLRSYSPSEAVVAIWGTGVLVMEGRQVDQPRWQTTEVTLRWEDARWRLVGFRSEDGPAPPRLGSHDPGTTGRAINAFGSFVYLPAEQEPAR